MKRTTLLVLLAFTTCGRFVLDHERAEARTRPTIEDLDRKLNYLTQLLYQRELETRRDKRLISEFNRCHEKCNEDHKWPDEKDPEYKNKIEDSQSCHKTCKDLPSYIPGGC